MILIKLHVLTLFILSQKVTVAHNLKRIKSYPNEETAIHPMIIKQLSYITQ